MKPFTIKRSIEQINKPVLFRRFGAWLSGLCAIHCMVFPLALVFIPFAESYLHFNIAIEIAMYTSILLIGGSFMWQDYKRHLNRLPIALFLTGFALLFIAHCVTFPVVHFSFMVLGGALLAIGQLYNIRLHKLGCPNKKH